MDARDDPNAVDVDFNRADRVTAAAVGRILTQPLEFASTLDNFRRAPEQPNQVTVNGQPHDLGFLEKMGAGEYNDGNSFQEVLNRPYDATKAFVQDHATKTGQLPSEDDVRKFYTDYLGSDNYRDFRHARMPWDKRMVEGAGHAINDLVGAPQDADQTTSERLGSSALQLMVQSPYAAAKVAAEKMGLGKTASLLENLSHGTFAPSSYHPSAFVPNLAVGGTIIGGQEALNEYMSHPNHPDVSNAYIPGAVDDYGRPQPPSTDLTAGLEDPIPSTYVATKANEALPAWASLPVFAMAGMAVASKDGAALAKAMAEGAAKAGGGVDAIIKEMPTLTQTAERSAGKPFGDYGPTTLKDASTNPLDSLVKGAKQKGQQLADATDQLAPVQRNVAAALDSNVEARDAMNRISVNWGQNAGESAGAWDAAGHLLDGTTIPSGQDWYATRDMVLKQMGPEGVQQYSDWVHARTVERTMQNQIADKTQELSALYEENVKAAKRGDGVGFKARQEKIAEVEQKLQDLQNDEPTSRYAMQDIDRETRLKMIEEGYQNPLFQKVDAVRQQIADAEITMRVNRNLASEEQKAYLKDRFKEDYSFIQSDPFQTTGVTRVVDKGMYWLGKRNENPFGDPTFHQNFDPFGRRNVADASSGPQLNKLVNVWDATHASMERAIRTASREIFIRDAIEAAEVGPKFENVGKKIEWNNAATDGAGSKTQLTPGQIAGIRARAMGQGHGDPFESLVAKNVGGKYEFYHFEDPTFKAALEQQPTQSWAFFRSLKRLSQLGATGTLRPGFAVTGLMHSDTRINSMRKMDSAYGIDYLGMKGLQGADALREAFGAEKIDPNGTVAKAVMTGGRVLDSLPLGANVVHAMNMVTAARLFVDQNAFVINSAIQRQLVTDTGFFSQVAKVPGGKAFLEAVPSVLSKAYVEGLSSALLEGHAGELAGYSSNVRALREVDRMIGDLPKWMTAITSPLGFVIKEYRMMVSSIHNAPRIGYALRMADYLDWKYDGKVPEGVAKTAQADARTLTGDLSRRMGDPTLQKLDSTTAYNIVTLRGTQEVFRRAVADPRVALSMVSGAVGPALFSAYWMSNNAGKDGFDYYWNYLSVDHRVRFNMIPTLPEIIRWAEGKQGAFDPANYYSTSQGIEFRPYAQVAVEGVRALGLALHNNFGLNVPGLGQNNKVAASSSDHIREALKQAFSIATPTILDVGLAQHGMKLELGNIWTKHPIYTEPRTSKSPGNDMMNISSDVPKAMADALATMFTATGKVLPEALDTGIKNFKGSDIADKMLNAVTAGGKEAWQRWSTDQSTSVPIVSDLFPNAPFFGRGAQHVYRDTDQSRYTHEVSELFKTWSGHNSKMKPQDPNNPIDQIGYMIKQAGANGPGKYLFGAMNEYNDDLRKLDANRDIPYLQRNDARNQTLLLARDKENKLLQFYNQVEKEIAQSPGGQAFAQQTGKPFNFHDFMKVMDKRAREMKQQPVQRRYTQP